MSAGGESLAELRAALESFRAAYSDGQTETVDVLEVYGAELARAVEAYLDGCK